MKRIGNLLSAVESAAAGKRAALARQRMADHLLFMANGLALGFCGGCGALFLFARMLSIPAA